MAEVLAETLGVPVDYFADPDDDLDDDCAHRFLILHWCCTWRPQSNFVKHLLSISGAPDINALMAALIAPESYRHPFEMNNAFFAPDAIECRFAYPAGTRIATVGFVFFTHEAREAAYYL